jgi:preprotein translocase subunit Sss1
MLADPGSLISLTLMPLVMMAFLKPLARLALTNENPGANGSEYTVPAMTTLFAFFLVGFVGFA